MTICIISTLKLLRAIAISVHMLCLLHIYCTMFIAAFKTDILLCYELLEGTCHIREYAVSSIFLFADFLSIIMPLNAACTGVVLLKGSFPLVTNCAHAFKIQIFLDQYNKVIEMK